MRRAFSVVVALVLASAGIAARQTAEDQQALREQIEARFEVVPLSAGIALHPKSPIGDVRLIEITDVIAINGVPVSGRELREKLGADADGVLRVSYLTSEARRELFKPKPEEERPRDLEIGDEEQRIRRDRRSHGDRVRVFGDIHVREDEAVSGQVVAVLGSVRIEGEAGDQVVAVLGSVYLGPKAVVRGEVVSVGGRVHREPGAQVRGGVTEVALGDAGVSIGNFPRGGFYGPFGPWGPFGFGPVTRLIGTTVRFGLLLLFTLIIVVLGRRSVENAAARLIDNPAKATLIGLATFLLIGPVLLLTCFVLAVSIIGIPLLLLVPFAVLALIVVALVGFTGTAAAVGQWTRRRFGATAPATVADVALGVFVILLPLLVARTVGIVGWPLNVVAAVFVLIGILVEGLAWSSGFGAVLTNVFSRWQARRAARANAVVPQQG
jgi:hypothetical protein